MLEQEIAKVVDYRDNQDKTWVEIGAIMGFSAKTAARRYASAGSTTNSSSTDIAVTSNGFPAVPADTLPAIDLVDRVPTDGFGAIARFRPMEVFGDAFVISDVHIPLYDPWLFNKMLASAEAADAKTLIINGDFWHQEAFSSFLPHQPEASLEVERYHGNTAMRTLLSIFDRVYMTCGNHDFRLSKKLGFTKSFEDCMHWMFYGLTEEERSRLSISSLDYMFYRPVVYQPRVFRVCHQRNFSIVPLATPRALAVKYEMSIIAAHAHHLAMGISQDGKHLIMENGGFFDPQRTEYIQATGKGHNWVQGWIEFKDGIPTLKSPVLLNV